MENEEAIKSLLSCSYKQNEGAFFKQCKHLALESIDIVYQEMSKA